MSRDQRWRAAAGGLWHASAALAAFYLALLVWLSVIALGPALIGWTPYVITSGSMAPRIPAGTILVAGPPPEQRLAPGAVVVYTDRSGRTVSHRVAAVDGEGRYRTRGDANPLPDGEPVGHDQLRGVGRIVVPLLGLPVVWALQGRWALTALAVGGSLAAAWVGWRAIGFGVRGRPEAVPRRTLRSALPRRAEPTRPPPDPAGEAQQTVDPGGPGRLGKSDQTPPPGAGGGAAGRQDPVPVGGVAGVVGVALLTALLGGVVTVAAAAFAAEAQQPANRWVAAGTFDAITTAVSAGDLPRAAASASQVFAFTFDQDLVPGAEVRIDLTEPYRGPVDYRQAHQPVASAGTADLETRRGNSSVREAEIVWVAPAGGWPAGEPVTITIPGGIATDDVEAGGLPATFTRTDTGEAVVTLFAVR